MYRIRDAESGGIIEEVVQPLWLKQQRLVDLPILCDEYGEADGLVLSDGETKVGIAGRNMENYPPLVAVEEISSDPYVFARLDSMQQQLDSIHNYQTETTVLKSELDAAYKEGVNAYV